MKSRHDMYGEYRAASRRYRKQPTPENYALWQRRWATVLEHGVNVDPRLWSWAAFPKVGTETTLVDHRRLV